MHNGPTELPWTMRKRLDTQGLLAQSSPEAFLDAMQQLRETDFPKIRIWND